VVDGKLPGLIQASNEASATISSPHLKIGRIVVEPDFYAAVCIVLKQVDCRFYDAIPIFAIVQMSDRCLIQLVNRAYFKIIERCQWLEFQSPNFLVAQVQGNLEHFLYA